MNAQSLNLVDNPAISGREDKYQTIEVDMKAILKSWKISLFSFEWLTPDGQIRKPSELPAQEKDKYENILSAYSKGDQLERPILGIGVMDNVEIGSRRDVLLTLAAQGVDRLQVHVQKQNLEDFIPYQ